MSKAYTDLTKSELITLCNRQAEGIVQMQKTIKKLKMDKRALKIKLDRGY